MKIFTKILSLLLLTGFGLATPSFAMQHNRPSHNKHKHKGNIKNPNDDKGYECPICFDTAQRPGEVPLLLISTVCCKHTSHVDCLSQWTSQHSTCPLCRGDFRTLVRAVVNKDIKKVENIFNYPISISDIAYALNTLCNEDLEVENTNKIYHIIAPNALAAAKQNINNGDEIVRSAAREILNVLIENEYQPAIDFQKSTQSFISKFTSRISNFNLRRYRSAQVTYLVIMLTANVILWYYKNSYNNKVRHQ